MKLMAMERRWGVAVMEGFAPAGNPGLAPRAGEVDYLAALDGMLTASTRFAALGLRAAIWIATLSPLFLMGRWVTLGALPALERSAVIGRLLQHPFYLVRELGLYLKLTTCMALFAVPALRERSGYDAAPVPAPGVRSPEAAALLAPPAPAAPRLVTLRRAS